MGRDLRLKSIILYCDLNHVISNSFDERKKTLTNLGNKLFNFMEEAALEAPRVLNLSNSKHFSGSYGEDVVFIANDWHTALLPCYLKSIYIPNGIYMSAKGTGKKKMEQ